MTQEVELVQTVTLDVTAYVSFPQRVSVDLRPIYNKDEPNNLYTIKIRVDANTKEEAEERLLEFRKQLAKAIAPNGV